MFVDFSLFLKCRLLAGSCSHLLQQVAQKLLSVKDSMMLSFGCVNVAIESKKQGREGGSKLRYVPRNSGQGPDFPMVNYLFCSHLCFLSIVCITTIC
jgi:hypothetical protein